jgi:hypothetical protein
MTINVIERHGSACKYVEICWQHRRTEQKDGNYYRGNK